MRKLILTNFQSPGDIVMLTAAVRDLHRCHPGRFVTDVRTSCPDLWLFNPHVNPLDEEDPEVEVIRCEYPLIHRRNQEPWHFLHGFVHFLAEPLDVPLRVTAFKGDIHISDAEKDWFSTVESLTGSSPPFWLLTSGGKNDYTIKWWDRAPLEAVVDLRGATTLRQLVRLMYHAQGAVSAVSLTVHLAAAV